MKKNKFNKGKNENVINFLMQKFIPFWPLLAILLFVFIGGAWLYLKYLTVPVYEATATLIINDEKKGVDQSAIMESIDLFDSKKIIENEIEVIQSREVINRVVSHLNLEAPVFKEDGFKEISAYSNSPLRIKVRNPEVIPIDQEEPFKHYFNYDKAKDSVKYDDSLYSLNEWIDTPQGTFMFVYDSTSIQTSEDLYFYLVNPRIIVRNISDNLSATATDKLSSVVNLTYNDEVPQRAEDILNSVITFYNQKTIEDKNVLARNTMDFIDERMAEVEGELSTLEGNVQQFRSGSDVVDLSEQGKLYLEDRGANNRKISEIEVKLAILNQISDMVGSSNSAISPSSVGIDDPVLEDLLSRLNELELEYESLKRTTAENNPIVLSVQNEIQKLQRNITQNINNQRSNLQASLTSLNNNAGRYSSVLRGLPEKEKTLVEITRKKEVKNDLYSFLLQKREETALSFGPVAGESRIVDRAETSLKPVSPKKPLVYLIAIIIAFFITVIYVLFKEVLTNKILFRSEIENYLDIPVAAELPLLNKGNTPEDKENNESILTGQFRNIRLALGLYTNGGRKKRILVSSCIEGDGKSFVSSNLAKILASKSQKTLLIDFDFHKGTLSNIFPHEESEGLAEVLKNGDSPFTQIQPTEFENLDILPAGKATQQTLKVMLESDLEAFFNELQREYEYIVVDTVPLTVSRDTDFLARYCDNILFVVRHNHTPKNQLEKVTEFISENELEKMHLVFNGFKSRGFVNSGYGDGYGYQNKNKYESAYGSLAKE